MLTRIEKENIFSVKLFCWMIRFFLICFWQLTNLCHFSDWKALKLTEMKFAANILSANWKKKIHLGVVHWSTNLRIPVSH